MTWAIIGIAFALIVIALGAWKQKNGLGRDRARYRSR